MYAFHLGKKALCETIGSIGQKEDNINVVSSAIVSPEPRLKHKKYSYGEQLRKIRQICFDVRLFLVFLFFSVLGWSSKLSKYPRIPHVFIFHQLYYRS